MGSPLATVLANIFMGFYESYESGVMNITLTNQTFI